MFLTLADLDGDGARDVLVATRDNGLLVFLRRPGATPAWHESLIFMPASAVCWPSLSITFNSSDTALPSEEDHWISRGIRMVPSARVTLSS